MERRTHQNLSDPFSVRVSKKTEKKIEQLASKAHMPISTYLRFCIEKLDKEFGLPRFDQELKSRG